MAAKSSGGTIHAFVLHQDQLRVAFGGNLHHYDSDLELVACERVSGDALVALASSQQNLLAADSRGRIFKNGKQVASFDAEVSQVFFFEDAAVAAGQGVILKAAYNKKNPSVVAKPDVNFILSCLSLSHYGFSQGNKLNLLRGGKSYQSLVKDDITAMEVGEDMVVAGTNRGQLHIFGEGLQFQSKICWHTLPVRSICITGGGQFYSGGGQGVVVRWRGRGTHRDFIPRIGGPIKQILPCKRNLYALLQRNQLAVLQLQDYSMLKRIAMVLDQGRILASVSSQNSISLFSEFGLQVLSLENYQHRTHPLIAKNFNSVLDQAVTKPLAIRHVAFARQMNAIGLYASAGTQRTLQFYDLSQSKYVLRSQFHFLDDSFKAIACGPDDSFYTVIGSRLGSWKRSMKKEQPVYQLSWQTAVRKNALFLRADSELTVGYEYYVASLQANQFTQRFRSKTNVLDCFHYQNFAAVLTSAELVLLKSWNPVLSTPLPTFKHYSQGFDRLAILFADSIAVFDMRQLAWTASYAVNCVVKQIVLMGEGEVVVVDSEFQVWSKSDAKLKKAERRSQAGYSQQTTEQQRQDFSWQYASVQQESSLRLRHSIKSQLDTGMEFVTISTIMDQLLV